MLNSFHPSVVAIIVLSLLAWPPSVVSGADTIDVGQRLELFVDDFLTADIQGDARQHLVLPEAQDVVFENEKPWEGNTSGYYAFFQEGDKYRMVCGSIPARPSRKAAKVEQRSSLGTSKPVCSCTPLLGTKAQI